MDVGTCVTLLYGKTKQKYILHLFDSFLAFFSTLPSTQTIDYRSNYELALKNWAMNMNFNHIPIL